MNAPLAGVCFGGSLGLAFVALALLALTQKAHYTAVTGRSPSLNPARVRRMRVAAITGLIVSFGLCWMADGAAFGSLLFVLELMLAAIGVSMTLAFRPHWLRALS